MYVCTTYVSFSCSYVCAYMYVLYVCMYMQRTRVSLCLMCVRMCTFLCMYVFTTYVSLSLLCVCVYICFMYVCMYNVRAFPSLMYVRICASLCMYVYATHVFMYVCINMYVHICACIVLVNLVSISLFIRYNSYLICLSYFYFIFPLNCQPYYLFVYLIQLSLYLLFIPFSLIYHVSLTFISFFISFLHFLPFYLPIILSL